MLPAFVRAVFRLSAACAVIAAVMLLAAALVITWSIIYRALGASTYWELEFSVYMMVGSIFLASPYCLSTRGHVGVDLLSHYLPERYARHAAFAVALLGLAVCVYLTYAGAEMTLHAFAIGERTESAWAPPKWPLFLTMPVGLGLTALQYVAELLRDTMNVAGER
ncbi:MAG: TRAP transporter small permease [Burkholderiaceae bacterium]|jgi:TRAP-type C4-dicarboxylate transport system permease small subunit|nr:TRAP transporter small permease [Burkholderiaceae bacterium]MDH5207451.1 TRAP transporter small permease [Burkholderiaceae bacterium]